jgi:hypothetical protein
MPLDDRPVAGDTNVDRDGRVPAVLPGERIIPCHRRLKSDFALDPAPSSWITIPPSGWLCTSHWTGPVALKDAVTLLAPL